MPLPQNPHRARPSRQLRTPHPTHPIPATRTRRNTTCDHCRKRHIKCDQALLSTDVEGSTLLPCAQCAKDRVRCVRTARGIRFSDESGKVGRRGSCGSGGGQAVLGVRVPKKLVYIDETAELNAIYRQDDDAISSPTRLAWLEGGEDVVHVESTTQQPPRAAIENTEPSSSAIAYVERTTQQPAGQSSETNDFVLRGLVKAPWQRSPNFSYNRLEFLLLGYYIDHLSMWLDFCDPQRHFQLVVPQRARECPPLMNAILAASARHLTRVPNHRTPSGAIQYDGRVVEELNDETALHYHNKCIHDLLALAADPEHTRNEDLLAAAIILRFYEEVDYPLQDEKRDNELFLRVTNIFIDAQIPSIPLSPLASIAPVPSLADTTAIENPSPLSSPWYMANLRQAAFWVAFRQEVYSAFLKQRPFNMSLSRCEVFRSFAPAEDALWTARAVVFCADVLECCYGNTSSHPAPELEPDPVSAREKWSHLSSLSEKWSSSLPASFEPIYFRPAEITKNKPFPEISYLTNLHVAGIQHIELARILLTVFNPTIPKPGLGLGLGHRQRTLTLRASVLRLCGIAIHNRKNPPSLTTALLGIVACGEVFDDPREQRALLGLLDELEGLHGWPVGGYREGLREAWGWRESSLV
ncbi:hypothetical protein BJX70DRAFT_74541 [Aspergillus crustosus]